MPNSRVSQRVPFRAATCVLLTGWICFFLISDLILGTSVRVVNLVEMVSLADRIFLGQCVSFEDVVDPVLQMPVTEYRFVVQQGIKGVGTGEEILVRQIGGIFDIPRYQKGERLLIFLHVDSQLGLTSPVGMGQGIFQVEKGSQGITVTNALQNQNLVYNLTGQLPLALDLNTEDLEDLTEERIDLEVMLTILGRISSSLDSVSPR